jgi:hypothetical protein
MASAGSSNHASLIICECHGSVGSSWSSSSSSALRGQIHLAGERARGAGALATLASDYQILPQDGVEVREVRWGDG